MYNLPGRALLGSEGETSGSVDVNRQEGSDERRSAQGRDSNWKSSTHNCTNHGMYRAMKYIAFVHARLQEVRCISASVIVPARTFSLPDQVDLAQLPISDCPCPQLDVCVRVLTSCENMTRTSQVRIVTHDTSL